MKEEYPMPPRAFLRFFRWYCHPGLVEGIEGDLLEVYLQRVGESGKRKADLKFIIDVLLLFRPGIVRPGQKYHSTNNYAMFRNYLKVGWRTLMKQRMYSAINIGGFALGIAACILIALFIQDELSYDRQYPDAGRIYRVVGVYNDNGEIEKGVHFQPPMAGALMEDYSEIEKAGKYNNVELFGAASAEIRRDDRLENSHEETTVYFDQALLDILQPPMIYGDRSRALTEPRTVVISKRKADVYFPGENPVGKMLIINDDKQNPYTVTGVIENFPATSHLNFDFLFTLTKREFWKGEETDWCCSNYPTYILVKPGTDVRELEKKMTKGIISKYILPRLIKEGRVDAEDLVKKASLELQPVTEIHLHSDGIRDGLSHGDIRYVWMFGIIAGFVLIIACINFINLSTAKSANRAREVGLRKVVGSYRTSLINQFLIESLIYSFLSFVFGLLLVSLLLPYFNILSGKSLVFPWSDWRLFPGILLASIVVGIFAGVYPSFYLSGFKPIQVLKGNISLGSKSSGLRSTLVVFQFTISIVLIAGTFIISRQMEYILNSKIGFDKEHVLVIQGTSTLGDQVKVFKEELKQLPGVRAVSVGDYLPVRGGKRNGNQFFIEGRREVDKPVGGQFWRVDHDYLKTMGMKITEGRNFDINRASDSAAAIINQQMAKSLGLKNPVGARIANYSAYTVIGVVEDFHFESFKQNIEPLVMVLGNSPTMVSVKMASGDMREGIESVTRVWKKLAPQQPVRYTFLDQSYARMYDDVQRMGWVFTSCAVFAIIVACLGLFGLSSFMVEQRGKEISIRLVLGASLQSILRLLMQNFLKLVLIAFILAAPIAWYIMDKWLEGYSYKVDITWDVFLSAGVLSALIALVTIGYQSIRAALISPVENLRSE